MLEVPAAWRAREPRLIADTVTSRVYRVRLATGASAIVKQLKPIADLEAHAAAYLWIQDGRGAVRLLASAGPMMLLLEDAGDRHLLHIVEREGDDAATDLLAAVLGRLHVAPTSGAIAGLLPLEEHLASLFVQADRATGALGERLRAAARVARDLLDQPTVRRALHGDLHHENVLESARGWLAIDPKGLFGDPAFDAAHAFYNPMGRDDLRLDPRRIAAMANAFAGVLGRGPADVLDWAIVDVMLSAAWHTEDGLRERVAADLRIADALWTVRRSLGRA